jgi:hypothetical protein
MDPFTLLFFGFLWFLFSRLRKAQQQQGDRTAPPRPLPSGSGVDASQREGSRLEALFRELERTLNEQAGLPSPRPASLPPAEEEEELETLEAETEVVSLEQEVRRAPRVRVVRDEQAELVEPTRVAAAQARSGALTRADHAAFDARIRAQPADATAVRTPTAEQLRRAVVWREILGPPAAVRDLER